MKLGNVNEFLNPHSIFAIEPSFAKANFFKVVQILKGHQTPIQNQEQNQVEPNCFINDDNVVFHNPNTSIENSILVFDIYSVITKFDQFSGSYGMQTFASMVKQADANQNIKSILLYINSGGGEGYAAMEMVNALRAFSKPKVAFIDDFGASAAAWIATACDLVFANTPMAQFGSFGTYMTIADFTEQLKMEGVKLIEVYADKSTEKNLDHKEALDGNTDLVKEKINKFNDNFLKSVREYRGEKLKSDIWEKGNMFFADKAKELGLIDGIDTIENVIKSLKKL